MEAARNGDTTAVRAVLDLFRPDREKVAFDAAHEACRGNYDECLTLLLPYVETTQMGFGILLSECVHADHVACTEVLLQHWKSVCNDMAFVRHEPVFSAGQSASLCPAMWSDPAVCRVLIDAGADLHTKNNCQESPLHYACKNGALDVVKMLIEAGAVVRATDTEGHSGTHPEGCTCLFLDTCLTFAVRYEHTDLVRYLAGLPEVDVNHRDTTSDATVLHYAVNHRKKHTIVQVLIDAGADVDAQENKGGRSPLHFACASGVLDVVKMLVEAGAGVCVTDSDGCTCLHYAARYGNIETVRYLVGLPEVDVNHADCHNHTALHKAVVKQHTEVVQVLIDAGADVNAHNIEGLHYTALHTAVVNKRTEVVQILIDAGADIDAQNNEGRSTPLHSACSEGALEVVKMLLEAGAGVRVADNDGCTCLHFAACLGHTETVRYLVALPEVDVNHADCHNHTALHKAVVKQDTEVVQILIDAGHKTSRDVRLCILLAHQDLPCHCEDVG